MNPYQGPLAGLRVVEMAGIGPAPFAAQMLRQMGAEVVRLDRPATPGHTLHPIDPKFDLLNRDKPVLTVDLKSAEGVEQALAVIDSADILLEGFRPGVMERLGLGPETCLGRNPRLVFGRVTGWGQTGPLAQHAGHDITYLALTGALAAIGERGRGPVPPVNFLGDFAGGSLYLVAGVLAALTEARTTGRGQIVDAAMIDGVTHMMSFVTGLRQAGFWSLERGANQPDGGWPFNAVYACADGAHLAVAAAEMKFRLDFSARIGLPEELARSGDNPALWDEIRTRITEILATRTRDDWMTRLDGPDTCVAPVLDMDAAPRHPQIRARALYRTDADGVRCPEVAPAFSQGRPRPPRHADAAALVADWAAAPRGTPGGV